MRVRSPKWSTVALPRAAYRELVRPLHHFTQVETPVPPGATGFCEDAWNDSMPPGEYEDFPWQ